MTNEERERLLRVADAIEAHPLDFNMANWVDVRAVVEDGEVACRTTCCIAGFLFLDGRNMRTPADVPLDAGAGSWTARKEWGRHFNVPVADIQRQAAEMLPTVLDAWQVFFAKLWPLPWRVKYMSSRDEGHQSRVAAAYIRWIVSELDAGRNPLPITEDDDGWPGDL
jgi:hypothetical protein